MPSVTVVNGKQIVVEHRGPLQRLGRFFISPFSQMWHHRDLIAAILRREVNERFKGSVAGWVWAVIAPLLAIAVYTFAFTSTVKIPLNQLAGSKLGYALFIFSGILVLGFFSEMAFRAPMLLHEYAHFIKQTIFPSDMLAVISTLRATVYTLISLTVMLIFQLIAMDWTLPWTILLLPLVFVPLIFFLIGLSWVLSAIGAFTRDAGYLMINVAPLFLFATPVFYSQDSLGPPWNVIIYANALTGFVEVTRDIVLYGKLPSMLVYGWTLLTSVVTFYFGYAVFNRYRNVIVDVI